MCQLDANFGANTRASAGTPGGHRALLPSVRPACDEPYDAFRSANSGGRVCGDRPRAREEEEEASRAMKFRAGHDWSPPLHHGSARVVT